MSSKQTPSLSIEGLSARPSTAPNRSRPGSSHSTMSADYAQLSSRSDASSMRSFKSSASQNTIRELTANLDKERAARAQIEARLKELEENQKKSSENLLSTVQALVAAAGSSSTPAPELQQIQQMLQQNNSKSEAGPQASPSASSAPLSQSQTFSANLLNSTAQELLELAKRHNISPPKRQTIRTRFYADYTGSLHWVDPQ